METMETPEDISTALRQLPDNAPVISLYLPVRPGLNFPQSFKAEALDLIRGAKDNASGIPAEVVNALAERVLTYVRDEAVPEGRTLVIFAAASRDEFYSTSLSLALPGIARCRFGPYRAPLQAVQENNPRLAIVCVNEREGRIIVISLGRRESGVQVHDDIRKSQRQGGWAAFRFERERAQHVEDHLRHVAGRLAVVQQDTGFARIVFGGTTDVLHAIEAFMPQHLLSLVAGSFPMEIFSTDAELIASALPIAAEAERREEVDLAQLIKDTAMAAGQASLGWDETLSCLGEGRVHVLAVPLAALGSPSADLALTRAFETGARIEFIGPEAEAVLREAAGVGALLRF